MREQKPRAKRTPKITSAQKDSRCHLSRIIQKCRFIQSTYPHFFSPQPPSYALVIAFARRIRYTIPQRKFLVVCAPPFPSPEQTTNGKAGFEGASEQPFAQGRFSISSAGLSACSGNLLIFLSGCAAYGLLFKQTRALRSNSVFKAIAPLARLVQRIINN